MKTYLSSNAFVCRRDIAHVPLPWPVTILHNPREWTPAHKENNINTSVKSNICNYTSVRKDIIQHQPLQVQREWNHNDSHLFINIQQRRIQPASWRQVLLWLGAQLHKSCKRLKGWGTSSLSLFSDKVSLLRESLMDTKKASCNSNLLMSSFQHKYCHKSQCY